MALYGLEDYLLDFVASRKMPKPHPGASRGVQAKRAALGIVRYADDFVIIHRNSEIMQLVIAETKVWLRGVGLEISEEKSGIRLASQSFAFLSFSISYVRILDTGKFKVKIVPIKANVLKLTRKVKQIVTINKASSAYHLIGLLRPVLIGWGNYFQYCECKLTFTKVDNIIWNMIRAWVFRLAIRKGRQSVKDKYFPSGKTYTFRENTYKANWILNGTKVIKGAVVAENHLPKLSWIGSKNFAKIKGHASLYDGNEVYWALRTRRYSSISTRVSLLIQRQRGKCAMCCAVFTPMDVMEVDHDHVQPLSKGGKDEYSNLQLLHRQCHVQKTKKDLGKS